MFRIEPQGNEALHEVQELRVVSSESSNVPSQRTLKLRCAFATRSKIVASEGNPQMVSVAQVFPLSGRIEIAFFDQRSGALIRRIVTRDLPDRWTVVQGTRNLVEIPITQWDIEELNGARCGQDLYVTWVIDMVCLAQIEGKVDPSLSAFYDSPAKDSEYRHVSPQSFNQDFIAPSGLPERLLLELAIQSVPESLRAKVPSELQTLGLQWQTVDTGINCSHAAALEHDY